VTVPSDGNDGPRTARWLEVIADPVRLTILRSLSQVEEATASDLATWSQASSQTLRRHLEALVSLGVIREHPARSDGETPGRPPARFSLPAEMRESVRSVLAPGRGSGGGAGPGSLAQAVAAPAAATLASMSSMAAVGPMNGARAT
jgi:DNA-binding transcriptional ArsR family regulator